MLAAPPERRSSRSVPIIVAIIGLVGAIAAALIGTGFFASDDNGPEVTNGSEVADISGRYYLDPDSQRIVTIKRSEGNTFTISEKDTPWPFDGTISWVNGDTYQGDALFESGDHMEVVAFPRGDGGLDVEFHFGYDGDGNLRIDYHQFVPVGES